MSTANGSRIAMVMRVLVALLFLSGCATSPSQVANDMIGMSRGDILRCIGVPQGEASDGATHVMSYSASRIIYNPYWGPMPIECSVSVLLEHGKVIRVNYAGPRGPCMGIMQGCSRK